MSESKAYKPAHGGYPGEVELGCGRCLPTPPKKPGVGQRVRVTGNSSGALEGPARHYFPDGTEGEIIGESIFRGHWEIKAVACPLGSVGNHSYEFVQSVHRTHFELID